PGAPTEVREIYLEAELELPPYQHLPKGTTAKLSQNAVTSRPTLALIPGISIEDLDPESTRAEPIRAVRAPTLDDIAAKVDAFVSELSGSTKDIGTVLDEAKGFLRDLRAKLAD